MLLLAADPIAVRLDDTSDGELQLTTFILPLINRSLRHCENFSHQQKRHITYFFFTMAAPLTVSFIMSEASWSDILQDMMLDEMVTSTALVEMLNTAVGYILWFTIATRFLQPVRVKCWH